MYDYEIYSPDDMAGDVAQAIKSHGLRIHSDYSDYGYGVYFTVRCTPDQIEGLKLPSGSYFVGKSEPRRSELRAKYEVVSLTEDLCVIRDVGHMKVMTVTNDAEAVVRDLLLRAVLKPGMALHYYDSTGRLDGISWEGHGVSFYAVSPEE